MVGNERKSPQPFEKRGVATQPAKPFLNSRLSITKTSGPGICPAFSSLASITGLNRLSSACDTLGDSLEKTGL